MKRSGSSLTDEEATAVQFIANTNAYQWSVLQGFFDRQIERVRDKLEKPEEDVAALRAEVAVLRRLRDLDESARTILKKEKR